MLRRTLRAGDGQPHDVGHSHDVAQNGEAEFRKVAAFGVRTEHDLAVGVGGHARKSSSRAPAPGYGADASAVSRGGPWVIDDMSSAADGSLWAVRGLLGDAKHSIIP